MNTPRSFVTELSSVTIPEIRERVVVREVFPHVPGMIVIGDIFSIGNNFDQWFGDMVEDPIPQTVLARHVLNEGRCAKEIMCALSQKENTTPATFTEILSLWKKHTHNKSEDTVCRYGSPNLFFVRDVKGALRIANLHEYGKEWGVLVCDMDIVPQWPIGTRIFSRKPSQ